MPVPFEEKIKELIAQEGPVSLEHYMSLCLSYYYATRDPLGREGDFITSPEITQVFGEVIGAWFAQDWLYNGNQQPIHWIELGPGRGTLTSDILRVFKKVPHFWDNLTIHLVETSPVLRGKQQKTLKDYSVEWHTTLDTLPPGRTYFMANEFFDALPIKQFIRGETHWFERMVGIRNEELVFGYGLEPLYEAKDQERIGTIQEVPQISGRYIQKISEHLKKNKGIALIIDYGYWGPRFGDSLQALKKHKFIDPLRNSGDADLTVHVDFHFLAQEAQKIGLNSYGLISQKEFLQNLGIHYRAQVLMEKATPELKEIVRIGVERILASGRTGMGDLFKVIALSDPSISDLPCIPQCTRPSSLKN